LRSRFQPPGLAANHSSLTLISAARFSEIRRRFRLALHQRGYELTFSRDVYFIAFTARFGFSEIVPVGLAGVSGADIG
jgi:hypothetical protein